MNRKRNWIVSGLASLLTCVHLAVMTVLPWKATIVAGGALVVAVAPKTSYAGAGGIVFDPTNFAEAVKQSADWAVQHTDQLRSYVTQLSQLKAAIDQILALKDMAVKDLLAGLGLGDIMDSIRTVQGAIRDVQDLGSSVQQLRTGFSDFGRFFNSGNFKFTDFAYQQMRNAVMGGQYAGSEFNRRKDLLQQTFSNLQKVQRSQSLIGSKSQQSSLDNLNAQTQMVATGINTLLAEVLQENLYQSALRQSKANAQVTSGMVTEFAESMAAWRARLVGTTLTP